MQFFPDFSSSRVALERANAARALESNPDIEKTVREICEAVKNDGDDALLRFGRQFDCPTLELADLRVTAAEIEAAWRELSGSARRALERAAQNIEAFHRRQPMHDWMMTSLDGVLLGQRFTPIERAGLYAPHGRAAYPSTVLMLAMPARVAGVEQLALATPAGRDGKAHPVILAAAKVAGIEEIYKIGGAAAMAAMAYGTQSVPKVDKITGPGSIYLTLAKKQLFGIVGIDGLFGPSEVVIVADESAPSPNLAAQVAADLLAQAEHGADSFVAFVSPSRALCDEVQNEVQTQLEAAPRGEILRESLQNALVLHTETLDEACELANLAAAEHVEIWHRAALALSLKIRHAGAIFCNTPVPLGDYIAGPSHTLPTGGGARFSSGVGVETFLKRTSLIAAPHVALSNLSADLETLARLEDLPGHAAAVRFAAQNYENRFEENRFE